MAKEFENPIAVLSRRTSVLPTAALSGVVLACLGAGLAAAVTSASWPFTIIFLISIAGILLFTYLDLSHIRRIRASQSPLDLNSALPEVQRENLNIEVFELSKLLEVGTEQISDLQSAYIVAEDLALRQIQQEENLPLMRHVSIGGVPFDAVLMKKDIVVCIEIAFLVTPDIRPDKLDAIMMKAASVKEILATMDIGLRTRLMLVLVTQLLPQDEEQLRSELNTKKFESTPVDIDIRLLDFEALQKIFIAE